MLRSRLEDSFLGRMPDSRRKVYGVPEGLDSNLSPLGTALGTLLQQLLLLPNALTFTRKKMN